MTAGRLLTVEEVAEQLAVPVSFVRRLIHEKRITVRRVGRLVRFRQDDVDAFVDAGTTPGRDWRAETDVVRLHPRKRRALSS